MRQEVWGCPGELGGLIVGGTLLKCCLFSLQVCEDLPAARQVTAGEAQDHHQT